MYKKLLIETHKFISLPNELELKSDEQNRIL